jgi:hypothetical protein
MKKRTLAIAALSFLFTIPVVAEINDDAHTALPRPWFVTEEILAARLGLIERAVSDRVARLEGDLDRRVARLERELHERIAALEREMHALRAGAGAGERRRLEPAQGSGAGPEPRRPPAAATGAGRGEGLAALLAAARDFHARMQELQMRAEARGLEAAPNDRR